MGPLTILRLVHAVASDVLVSAAPTARSAGAVEPTMSAPGTLRRGVDRMLSARTLLHRVAFLAALRAFPAALRSLPFSSSPAPRASVPGRPDAFPDSRLARPLSSSALPLIRCAHVFSVPGDVGPRDSVPPGHVPVNAAGQLYRRCSANTADIDTAPADPSPLLCPARPFASEYRPLR